MKLRPLPHLAPALLALASFAPPLLAGPSHSGAPVAGDPAELLPERTLVCVSGPGLSDLFDRGLEHPAVRRFFDSDLGRTLLENGDTTPERALALGEAALGRPVLPTLSALTANGVAFGLAPGERGAKQPSLALLARAVDADAAEENLEAILRRVAEKAGFPRAFDRAHGELLGAELWKIGDQVRVARRGALVVVTNDEGYLREILQATPGAGATRRASFGSGGDRPANVLLWAWLDRARLAAALERTGQGQGLAKLALANQAPPAQYLLGPGLSAVGTADELGLAVRLTEGELDLQLRAIGTELARDVAPSAEPAAPAPALPASFGAADCATAVVYRDLDGLYAHRLELFPPDKGPALTRALSQLGLFFGGLELADEVLPALSPWLRVVVAPIAFEAGAAPEIVLPGAAVLVDVAADADRDEDLGPRLVAAFQSLIGVVGVDRAQKGMDPMVLHVALEGETEISYARFPKPQPGDGVDVQYNLSPACAVVGHTFVVGTHLDVVRRVVRDLAAGSMNRIEPGLEHLELFGPALAMLVERNYDALVMKNVYEKGQSREEAKRDLDGLRALLDWIERARISVRYPGDDAVEVRATLGLGSGMGSLGGEAGAGSRSEGLR